MVSPGLTDVAVATRRLAVLESSIIVSMRVSTLQDSQSPVHRYFASALTAQWPFPDLKPAMLASAAPAGQFETRTSGFPGNFRRPRSLR
jgi:anti-sigma factor RsiW